MSIKSALKRLFAHNDDQPAHEVAIEPFFAEERGRRSQVNPLMLAGLDRG